MTDCITDVDVNVNVQMPLQTVHLAAELAADCGYKPGPKFTDDLRTILRQFSELRQSYDNWQIHWTLM